MDLSRMNKNRQAQSTVIVYVLLKPLVFCVSSLQRTIATFLLYSFSLFFFFCGLLVHIESSHSPFTWWGRKQASTYVCMQQYEFGFRCNESASLHMSLPKPVLWCHCYNRPPKYRNQNALTPTRIQLKHSCASTVSTCSEWMESNSKENGSTLPGQNVTMDTLTLSGRIIWVEHLKSSLESVP